MRARVRTRMLRRASWSRLKRWGEVALVLWGPAPRRLGATHLRSASPRCALRLLEGPPPWTAHALVERCGAARELAVVGRGAARHVLRRAIEPGLAAMRLLQIAARTLVVREIEAVGILAPDSGRGADHVPVPADEVRDVGEVVAVGADPAGALLVARPRRVHDLSVSIGGRGARSWQEQQPPCARRARVRLERRLLVDDRELRGDGDAPALLA